MPERTAFVILAAIGLFALVLLVNAEITGMVTTNVCSRGTAPVISGERFLSEFENFQDRGYSCFIGFDGITPCCYRTYKVRNLEYLDQRQGYEQWKRFP